MSFLVFALIAPAFAAYSGSSANSVENPANFIPPFPQFPNFDFLVSYFNALQSFNQQLAENIQRNVAQTSGGGFGGGYDSSGGFGGSFSGTYGPEGSLASASIGPGGVQQTAAVYPENPAVPNVNTRFAAAGGPRGGSYGVFTSSQSATSNLNGKPMSFHRATTTVNDNGKVTTYTVQNP